MGYVCCREYNFNSKNTTLQHKTFVSLAVGLLENVCTIQIRLDQKTLKLCGGVHIIDIIGQIIKIVWCSSSSAFDVDLLYM